MASSLDAVLHDSLRRFTADVFKSAWRGREREAISLYAFGYLTIECHRGAVLEHASQIGIEVAVPQLPGAKRKRQVCKDLVTWPRPMMTCRNKDGAPVIHPLAVLQWKTGTAPVANDDFRWLSGYSRRNPGVAAYAVALNLWGRPFRLALTKFHRGKPRQRWLM